MRLMTDAICVDSGFTVTLLALQFAKAASQVERPQVQDLYILVLAFVQWVRTQTLHQVIAKAASQGGQPGSTSPSACNICAEWWTATVDGCILRVPTEDLMTAYNSASVDDTIELRNGSTFAPSSSTGINEGGTAIEILKALTINCIDHFVQRCELS